MILNFDEYFKINETLITQDPDAVVRNLPKFFIERDASAYREVNKNTLVLRIPDIEVFDRKDIIKRAREYFIVSMGWFPSKMKIYKREFRGDIIDNILVYDEDFILTDKYIVAIDIIFEARLDIIVDDIPNLLYHISIVGYNDKILSRGLMTKSENKLTLHPERIYFCDTIEHSRRLIEQLNFRAIQRILNRGVVDRVSTEWIIYEIDIKSFLENPLIDPTKFKLYRDPNYVYGYYTLDNIQPDYIREIERESDDIQ